MKRLLAPILVLASVLVLNASPARAESDTFTIEVSPGVAGANGLDSFGVGIAATIFILPTDVISIGVRPDFAWHKRDGGHDLFFSVNGQLDLSVSDTVIPSAWAGIGVKRHTNSGLDLDAFFAAGGMVTEGTLGLITSGKLGQDANGVAYNFGGQVKFVLADPFYVAPQFSFLYGDTKESKNKHYRIAIAMGLAF